MNSDVQAAAGRLGAITRRNPSDKSAISIARRDLKAARLEDHVRKVVAEAPPLTDEQADRIAAILRGAA